MGSGVPPAVVGARGGVVRDSGSRATDEDLTLVDALAGQLLDFFRCLDAGYHPDSPSEQSVITRVVSGFEIHRRDGAR